MNEKMTFPELVDAVAAATETSKKVSESFLKELFSTIADTLRGGDNVKVKGLGVFKLIIVEARKSVNVNTGEEMEIPSHRKVTFLPDKALADAINMPFASFETVVLSDALTDEDLKKMADVDEHPAEDGEEPQDKPTPPPFTQKADDDGNKDEASKKAAGNVVVAKEVEEAVAAEVEIPEDETAEAELEAETMVNDLMEADERHEELDADNEPMPEIEEHKVAEEHIEKEDKAEAGGRSVAHFDDEDDEEEEYLPQPAKDNGSFMRGFLWGAVTMFLIYMLVGGGIYLYKTTVANDKTELSEVEDSIDAVQETAPLAAAGAAAADSVAAVPEQKPEATEKVSPKVEEPAKVDKPVERYDTITRTKFLTRLAKKYYGNSDFWVYIYEENKAKIKNPNTISPGTVVVIPAADKYGIDKDNPESLKAARKKAGELECKYK